ncbi:hypothetical protein N7495_004481 [Penicillium taxi]|uniref:uncharacterized protein n=1 Tax=Penicillium taxi TaxID=168475 RepID=UPI0025453578|nr:uncharacterized protein N7495_004481 [Penicillium taxi]KAJ5899737.1 hypothetical protein N7495_004481 [Penicillium taxi]
METLGYFNQVLRSVVTHMAVQRFTIVNVMLAIFRQRSQYAPWNFVLYQTRHGGTLLSPPFTTGQDPLNHSYASW